MRWGWVGRAGAGAEETGWLIGLAFANRALDLSPGDSCRPSGGHPKRLSYSGALFRLRPPSDAQVLRLLERRVDAPFTYAHVGATRGELSAPPRGFVLDRYGAEVGRGERAFERARALVRELDNYPPSFTRIVRRPGPLEPGAVFATVATHFGFASVHPCRVIYVLDEPHRFGLGFGTLPGHAEAGEERFAVRMDGDRVLYEVLAISHPVGVLPRLGAPIARALQHRFQRETLATMKDRVAAGSSAPVQGGAPRRGQQSRQPGP